MPIRRHVKNYEQLLQHWHYRDQIPDDGTARASGNWLYAIASLDNRLGKGWQRIPGVPQFVHEL